MDATNRLRELLSDSIAEGLRGQDYIAMEDFTVEEIQRLVDVTLELKRLQKQGVPHPVLAGKSLAMIFQKPSTRTRVAFEVGMYQLGGYALFLNAQDMQLRRGETIGDTAKVLSRFVNGVMIRTFDHRDVTDLAEAASVPVINGLTDYLHPTQALADYVTILEHKGNLPGRKLVYVGDGNNVAHALIHGAVKLGVHLVVCTPSGFEPDAALVEKAKGEAGKTGAKIEVVHNPSQAVHGADVIYTDVWASMGQEEEHDRRVRAFEGYQVNQELVKQAKPDAIVMHDLPAHRGEEITDELMDGPQSVVFDEAENRLHAHKAIMALVMG